MKEIELNRKYIIKKISSGIESNIYAYKINSNVYCLKLFKNEIDFCNYSIPTTNEILENKKNKLQIIHENSLFYNETYPISLVYENGQFAGYIMKLENNTTANIFSKTKNKIEILKKYKEKIEKFNKSGIYIGDISKRNIIITNEDVKLCDLDNIKIGKYDFDILSLFQNEYIRTYNNIENIDKYCFNLFSISFLAKIIPCFSFDYLRDNKLPKPINSKKNYQLLKEKKYSEEYFIDNIKEYKLINGS